MVHTILGVAVIVSPFFCQGTVERNNHESYKTFIYREALNHDAARGLDVETASRIRKERGDRWADQVKGGQKHLCGKQSSNW